MTEFKTPLVYAAMDFTERDAMLRAADLLAPVPGDWGFKLNDDYVTTYGPDKAIADLAPYRKNLFVDYKLLKGARRMVNLVQGLAITGAVDFTNIYVLAGGLLLKTVEKTKDSGVGILGITILTHMDEEYCQHYFRRSLPEAVRMMTWDAHHAGCPGVILPGTCMEAVRDIPVLKVCPGVRPAWYVGKKANQQSQEVQPAEIIKAGGNTAVTGSPIWDTDNPRDSLMRILDEMNDAKARLV